MGFETIDTLPRMARNVTANPDGVSVGIYARGGDTPRLTIFVGRNILTKMGLALGDRVVVQEGTGPDHGMFRIEAAGTARVGLTLTARDVTRGRESTHMGQVSLDIKRTKTLRNAAVVAAEPATFERWGSALTIIVPWCHEPTEDSARDKESSK